MSTTKLRITVAGIEFEARLDPDPSKTSATIDHIESIIWCHPCFWDRLTKVMDAAVKGYQYYHGNAPGEGKAG